MKRIFQTIAVFLLPMQLFAQSPLKQGVIEYRQVLRMPKKAAQKNPMLAAITADGIQVQTTIVFQDEQFAITDGSKGQLGEVAFDLMEERQLVNLKNKTLRTESTIGSTTYYTEEGETKKPVIRYHKGTKSIAGYTCKRAFVQIDSDIYMVWYAPAIPFAYSPLELRFAGLKGAILEFQTEGSICTAVSVYADGFSAQDILPDRRAQEATSAQTKALWQKHMNAFSGKHKTFEVQ